MNKQKLISDYISEVYRFDLITKKNIVRSLLDNSKNVIINTICNYNLYDLIYILELKLEDLEEHCDEIRLESIIIDNIDKFETELLFYYLIKNNFSFSSAFKSRIIEIDYNNSILHYFIDNRKNKNNTDILNIEKVKNKLNNLEIDTNKDKTIEK
jgi:hypothetical protein